MVLFMLIYASIAMILCDVIIDSTQMILVDYEDNNMSEHKIERIEQGEMLLIFCVRLEWKIRTQNRKAKQPLPRLQPPNPRLHTPFRTRIGQGNHDQHSSFPPRPARSNTLEIQNRHIPTNTGSPNDHIRTFFELP